MPGALNMLENQTDCMQCIGRGKGKAESSSGQIVVFLKINSTTPMHVYSGVGKGTKQTTWFVSWFILGCNGERHMPRMKQNGELVSVLVIYMLHNSCNLGPLRAGEWHC